MMLMLLTVALISPLGVRGCVDITTLYNYKQANAQTTTSLSLSE